MGNTVKRLLRNWLQFGSLLLKFINFKIISYLEIKGLGYFTAYRNISLTDIDRDLSVSFVKTQHWQLYKHYVCHNLNSRDFTCRDEFL